MQPSEAGLPTSEELNGYLRQSLYRFDCPTPHALGEYELGFLDPVERTRVAAHAADCDDCLAELRLLRAYLAAPTAMPRSPRERARRVLASLFTPAPGLAYGGLRGSAETGARVFEADDVSVTIELGQSPQALMGLVLVTGAAPEALTGREARLVGMAGNVLSTRVDDLGNFELASVPVGTYVLEIDLVDRVVVIEGLQVD